MKKLILAVIIGAVFSGVSHAGFSLGMTGAFKKQADKLDDKVANRNAALLSDTQAPTVPASLTAVAVSSSQINLSWTASTDDVGVTSYKIYRDAGAAPIAAPAGTTYSNTGIAVPADYSYTVSACDAAGNCSGQSSAASDTIPAPPAAGGEWVFVPGNSSFGIDAFYIMKYEAKSVASVATSQADATPWVLINLANSTGACSALGSGYHLPTIAETQTINRNIEAQTANWADGTIGSLVSASGGLKRGNVGLLDSAGYDGGNPEFGTGRDEKAKLVLSNGADLWDWSGNVAEWIYAAGAGGTQGTPRGVTFDINGWYEWDRVAAPDLSQERPVLGPSNSGYTSLHGVGKYYGGATTNGVHRGNYWLDGVNAGVFAYVAANLPTLAGSYSGFRCAWATPVAASANITINDGYGIFFETGQVAAAASNPDMRNGPPDTINFRPTGFGDGEAKYKVIPACTGITNISSVDTTGYTSPVGPTGAAVAGDCYAVYLPDATYAAFEVIGTSPMVIRYKYQPNGGNLF